MSEGGRARSAKPIDLIRQASWFDSERAIGYARMALLAYTPYLFLVGQAVLGGGASRKASAFPDFVSYWTAARLAQMRGFAAAYDLHAQRAFEKALGLGDSFNPFVNPPPFLFVVLPFGGLPFVVAFALFAAGVYGAYLAAVATLARKAFWPAAAFPAAFVNAIHGQCAGLVAALFVGAARCLDRRPWLAGALFGLLVIKPQFALLIPLALAAGRRWASFAGAAITAVLALGLSLAALGPGGVAQYLQAAAYAGKTLGAVDTLVKMQSAYAAMVVAGAPAWAAIAVQAGVSASATAVVWWAWRVPRDALALGSILAICAVLATPYVFDYDLMILILPICWLADRGRSEGFLLWDRAVMTAAYIVPFAGRYIAMTSHLVIGPLVLLALLCVAVRRLQARPLSDPAGGLAGP